MPRRQMPKAVDDPRKPARDLVGTPPAARLETPRSVGLASARVVLVNGVVGDPLLHVRFRHQRRSLLFDLGEATRLPARIIHQVSDAFVTHGHFDHFGGFPWLLRARIGVREICRLYGPPGLLELVRGAIAGVLWDRIEDRGPRFVVTEVDGERLRRWRVTVGVSEVVDEGEVPCEDGVLLDDLAFRVRCTTVDHGTPVLAFALEQREQLNVRRERLDLLGVGPGPWLNELKRRVRDADRGTSPAGAIDLPDNSTRSAAELAELILLRTPGDKLAYATDFADTEDNRRRVASLARGATLLFCEASFSAEHVGQAQRTQHLTTQACGEIAELAEVERLAPFHFSRRYGRELEALYAEVAQAAGDMRILRL